MIAMKMAIPQWFRFDNEGAGPTRFLSCNSLVLRTPVAIRRFGSSRTGPEAEGNVARASKRAASTVVSTFRRTSGTVSYGPKSKTFDQR